MTFEMIGRLDECFLLSYAVDPVRAASLVPAGLEPITHRGCAFLNIVACRVDSMRPRFMPLALGVTYWHIAYRLQVRARVSRGALIDGLYFLRSDVDSPLVRMAGNRLTDFRFHEATVRFSSDAERWNLRVEDPAGAGSAMLCAHPATGDDSAPAAPFSSLEEREHILKYAPVALSVAGPADRLRITEVMRDDATWRESPISVDSAAWSYPASVGLGNGRLVRATHVSPIDYTWRLGRVVKLLATG